MHLTFNQGFLTDVRGFDSHRANMETSELLEVLRERIHLTVSVDSEWEYSGEYATIAVSLEFRDDEGESHTISHDYGSVHINSD